MEKFDVPYIYQAHALVDFGKISYFNFTGFINYLLPAILFGHNNNIVGILNGRYRPRNSIY